VESCHLPLTDQDHDKSIKASPIRSERGVESRVDNVTCGINIDVGQVEVGDSRKGVRKL